jgi:hypothetical protein
VFSHAIIMGLETAGMGTAMERQWKRDGFVLVHNLFSAAHAAQLAAHMEAIVAQWRECDHGGSGSAPPRPGAAKSIMHPLHPNYFAEGSTEASQRRVALLEAVADERVLRVCEAILGERACFRSAQFMINPTDSDSSVDGNWHRDAPLDSVPVGPIPRLEEEGLLRANSEGGGDSGGCVQLQIALAPSVRAPAPPGFVTLHGFASAQN